MNKLCNVVNLTLVGGWAEADKYTMRQPVNMIIVRIRGDLALNIATQRGGAFFTLDSGDKITLSSFNAGSDTWYFRGQAGAIVEIIEQVKP